MLALLAVVNASLIATPTELLHLIIYVPRVEALRTSTLGYEIATPTELPRVRTIHNGPLISLSSPCSINEKRATCTALPPTAPLHLIIYIPRVEALRTSTLGWGNATPTELPRVRTACYGLTIHCSRERTSHIGPTTHGRWERTIYDALLITNALINMEHDEGG